MQEFILPFITVGAAELGDKTQLAILLLSTRTRARIKLLAGAMLGFLAVDGVAVIAGSWIPALVPIYTIKLASSAVFILFGILLLREGESELEKNISNKKPFIAAFTLIFITEWGDKTQIITGLFAATANPLLVLAGALSALMILSAAAVYAGSFVSERIDKAKVRRIAGALFIVIGAASAFSMI
ncbi:MAG: TMEM165/GDT1 family protein [Candidatus Altiarchaeota archaeon]